MKMIEKLYDVCLNGELVGEVIDTPETVKASQRVDDVIGQYMPKEYRTEMMQAITTWGYLYGKQLFEMGFKCATSILTNADIEE